MIVIGARLILLLLSLGLVTSCAPTQVAVEEPRVVAPEGHSASDPMFQFQGTWEGSLTGHSGSDLADGSGMSRSFRVIIGPANNVSVLQLWEGAWSEVKHGEFRIRKHGSQAVIVAIDSGHDEDGTWVESWTFTLTHVGPDELIAYWLRSVNNLDMSKDADDFQYAWSFSGKMHRMSNSG